MSIAISSKDVNVHIEKVISLLKGQNYTLQATALTTHERKKLWELFYTFSQYGSSNCKFGDYYNLKSQKHVDNLNKEVFENADEETRIIIAKCGVDAKRVFVIDKNGCNIDNHLFNSMCAYSTVKIGKYTIVFTRDHPIDKESLEIKNFIEDMQQEKFKRYKDGEATFRVISEEDGKEEQIYFHSEGLHFGGYISFMGVQIGGNFGMRGFNFSGTSGMMKMDEGRANCINDLLPFFESFEELLSQA